jgi:glycosyltransferase involved in cell wall biosynthesis
MSKVSVIVPCYNQSQYLDECLQSILHQTYTNWECIIVNDGSSDVTEDIAKKWIEKDSRFKYIKKENGGLSSARNTGFKLASGVFIQFLDCDDLIHENKLFEQIELFNADLLLDISYTNFITFSGNIKNKIKRYADCHLSSLPAHDFLFKWEKGFSIPIHCALFKKEIFQNNTPFNISLKSKEDWFLWVELILKGVRIKILDKEYAFYRIHNKSISRNEIYNIESLINITILISLKIDEHLRDEFIIQKLNYISEKISSLILYEKKMNTISIKKSISYRLGYFLLHPFKTFFKLLRA